MTAELISVGSLVLTIAGLSCMLVYLLICLQRSKDANDAQYQAWDIERGRYVAALLAKSAMGDGPAASVVRPRQQSGPVKAEEQKTPIYQEGM